MSENKIRREDLSTFGDFLQESLDEDEAFADRWEVNRGLARFGARVREQRVAQGLSQGQLADEVGTGQPNISRIEHAAANPTYKTMMKIAKALGVELSELIVRDYRKIEQVSVSIEGEATRRMADAREGEGANAEAEAAWKRTTADGVHRLEEYVGGDDENTEAAALAS